MVDCVFCFCIMFWLGPGMTVMSSSMFSNGAGDVCLLDGSWGIVVVINPMFSNSWLGDCSLTIVCVGGCLLLVGGIWFLGAGSVAVYAGGNLGGSIGVPGGMFMLNSGYSDGGCVAPMSWVIAGSSDS